MKIAGKCVLLAVYFDASIGRKIRGSRTLFIGRENRLLSIRPKILAVTFVTGFATLAGVASNVSAVPITFTFEAQFLNADPLLLDAGLTMTNLIGSYTFESATVDSDTTEQVGDYRNAIVAVSFANAAGTATGSGIGGDIQVQNDFGEGDGYFFPSSGDLDLTGSPLETLILDSFFLSLNDVSAVAFTSDALPIIPPILDGFDTKVIELRYQESNDPNIFRNALYDIVSLRSVPEPATLALMALGLAAGVVISRKR